MPEQAGTQTGHHWVTTWCHGGVRLAAGRNSECSICFHIANTPPEPKESAGQWDINLYPDMLQPSKGLGEQWKQPEGRVAQGWLGDVKTWKSRGNLATERLSAQGTRGEAEKAWELTSYRSKAQNRNKLPTTDLVSPVKVQMKLSLSFRLRFMLLFLPCFWVYRNCTVISL